MKALGILMICLLALVPFLHRSQDTVISAKNTYTVSPSSKPYKGQYVKYTTYNEKTRQYYTLRSYLELLEEKGGGTLVLSKGTYSVTNNLYVPSNITIQLNDGAKVVKSMDTGTNKLAPSKSIFNLISTAKSGNNAAATKYSGEMNIKIIGKGSATIDLNFVEGAVVAGHNYLMLKNYLKDVGEDFIRINNTYNVFDKDTDKYQFTGKYIQ
jgi:hypothetical protein